MECPMCRGGGSCLECDELGAVTCRECDGLGCEVCRRSGAEPCLPCNSSGSCRRCQGEGQVDTAIPLPFRYGH